MNQMNIPSYLTKQKFNNGISTIKTQAQAQAKAKRTNTTLVGETIPVNKVMNKEENEFVNFFCQILEYLGFKPYDSEENFVKAMADSLSIDDTPCPNISNRKSDDDDSPLVFFTDRTATFQLPSAPIDTAFQSKIFKIKDEQENEIKFQLRENCGIVCLYKINESEQAELVFTYSHLYSLNKMRADITALQSNSINTNA